MNTEDQNQQNPSAGTDQPEHDNGEHPQVVYMARPLEPQKQPMSQEIIHKHEESKRLFPNLNLSQGEYVISAVKRHPIGLFGIWCATAAVIVALFGLVAILVAGSKSADYSSEFGGSPLSPTVLFIPAMLIALLALIFGFISTYIYNANRFYLTNESVIQHIQTSLFNMREQTISLANVEDASYTQDGVVPHMLNYGLLRLSTQGDETTYRFNYASNPSKQIAVLNDAVENFKNIRPMQH
jgi:hypothetical protein